MLEKVTKKTLKDDTVMNLPAGCDLGIEKEIPTFAPSSDVSSTSALKTIYVSSMSRTSDVAAAKRGELVQILSLLEKYKYTGDEGTKGHYQDLILRIRQSLKMN
jgi:hypothetical protein